jgi:hypothetical protein
MHIPPTGSGLGRRVRDRPTFGGRIRNIDIQNNGIADGGGRFSADLRWADPKYRYANNGIADGGPLSAGARTALRRRSTGAAERATDMTGRPT